MVIVQYYFACVAAAVGKETDVEVLVRLVELDLQVQYFQMVPRHPVAAFDAGASCGAVAFASYLDSYQPCLDSLDPSKKV